MDRNMAPAIWLSVICPTYNGEAYLSAALDSVAAQNHENIEVLIVDDGSTDATLEIIHAYRRTLGIRMYRQNNRNWVASTNFALSQAAGKYVCFLHQDDIWLSGRLHCMSKIAAEFPQAGLILHPSYFIDSTGTPRGMWSCPLPSYPANIPSRLLLKRLLVQNFISIPGAMFKREIALQTGGMDERLWYTADWDFWLKLARHSDAIYFPKALSAFRIHPASQTIRGSVSTADFQHQLNVVLERHIESLDASNIETKRIRRTAEYSNKVNAALAGAFHGERADWIGLILAFLSLGYPGWHRYFRDSRILERTLARIKAGGIWENI